MRFGKWPRLEVDTGLSSVPTLTHVSIISPSGVGNEPRASVSCLSLFAPQQMSPGDRVPAVPLRCVRERRAPLSDSCATISILWSSAQDGGTEHGKGRDSEYTDAF